MRGEGRLGLTAPIYLTVIACRCGSVRSLGGFWEAHVGVETVRVRGLHDQAFLLQWEAGQRRLLVKVWVGMMEVMGVVVRVVASLMVWMLVVVYPRTQTHIFLHVRGEKTLNLRLPPPKRPAVTSPASAGQNSPGPELRRGGGLGSVPGEAADDGHGDVASRHLLVPGHQQGLGGATLVPLVSSSWAVSCGEDGICSSGDPGGAANGVVRLPPQTDACLVCLEPSSIDLKTSSNQCHCCRICCATFSCFCFSSL